MVKAICAREGKPGVRHAVLRVEEEGAGSADQSPDCRSGIVGWHSDEIAEPIERGRDLPGRLRGLKGPRGCPLWSDIELATPTRIARDRAAFAAADIVGCG